jgi:hypothetical protein
MYDGVHPDWEAGPSLYLFHVEAVADDDAFLRVLGPFMVASATLKSAQMVCAGDHAFISIEAGGLDTQRAQTIVCRLRNLPVVRGVSFGWRNAVVVSGIVGHRRG